MVRCYHVECLVFSLDYLNADRDVIQYINDTKPFLKLYTNRKPPYTEYLKLCTIMSSPIIIWKLALTMASLLHL